MGRVKLNKYGQVILNKDESIRFEDLATESLVELAIQATRAGESLAKIGRQIGKGTLDLDPPVPKLTEVQKWINT